MQKLTRAFELFLFTLFTAILLFLFILNIPIFREPHGLLITNEVSDFSNTELIATLLFGSVIVCVILGILMVKWLRIFTAGMASNLWATTFFLLWVDSMFTLSVQIQSFRFLVLLALGLLFLYLFFFTLHYLGFPESSSLNNQQSVSKMKLMDYWVSSWMGFYFLVSIRLLLNSFGYPELQWPLAMGFCVLCFLNYLLLLFLKKNRGQEIRILSRIGRVFFIFWFLGILVFGMAQKWPH